MNFFSYVNVRRRPIVVAEEYEQLRDGGDAGATAMFVGVVRGGEVRRMFLEHYPQMTEQALSDIAAAAAARWEVLRIRVIHRVGALSPGEEIVFVGVSAVHRAAAFSACEYVADYLKSRAPFWKKETLADGEERWVVSTARDEAALRRWETPDE